MDFEEIWIFGDYLKSYWKTKTFFGALAKLRKPSISCVTSVHPPLRPSVRLSIRMEELGSG
jgi:hypothetical protein